jgi:two-component system CheB/CheR fusion protein
VQQVLNLLRQTRNFDFSGYKRSTLHRRIEGRMRERRCIKVDDYCQVLQREPAEVDALVSALLIKVTDFFRDPPMWEKLRKDILPGLLAQAAANGEIRVWSAGCATGEEAYSIAMLLADVVQQEQSKVSFRVFATDRDAGAITAARRGMYNQQQVRGLSPALLDRWFERVSESYLVRKDLRRYLVFGVHDVVNNACSIALPQRLRFTTRSCRRLLSSTVRSSTRAPSAWKSNPWRTPANSPSAIYF